MRFEEVTYQLDGRAITVPLRAELTVVAGLTGRARLAWAERALGALLGTRPGDGVTLVLVDSSGQRIRLQRDGQGAATVTDVATGTELSYAAAHLPLDGRFDWFASIGLDTDTARALTLLDASVFKGGDDFDPEQTDAALAETRDVLALVESEYQAASSRYEYAKDLRRQVDALDEQIRDVDVEWARRRQGEAAQAVERLEAELAVLNGALPPERAAAQAILAAAGAVEEWQRAATILDAAERDFEDRPRLDSKTLHHALTLPAEMPAGLDVLQDGYLAAARHRSELVAQLDEGVSSELPAPSAPWVLSFARHRHPELWDRAGRVRATRSRANDLSVGLGLGGTGHQPDLIRELEVAHAAVEQGERALAGAKVSALAMTGRRRLAKALEHERIALTKAGFSSWLAYQLCRIDVLLEPDALTALRVAEIEAQQALDAWHEVAGDVEAEAALTARAEIEHSAAEMAAAERTGAAAEALRRQLTEQVDPAYAAARVALLEACRPFEVQPEHAAAQVAELVSQASHARLQHALENADSTYRAAEARLRSRLAETGLPASSPADLDSAVATVTARAFEAAACLETPLATRSLPKVQVELALARSALANHSRPNGDSYPRIADTRPPEIHALVEERCRLLEEADRTERGLPDMERLADRREALQRRGAMLEASWWDGYHVLNGEEAEMVLLGRIAQARRVGPKAESVPILIDDCLAGFPRRDKRALLDLIARLSQATQIVYLTDERETVEWARSRHDDVALLHPEADADLRR